MSNSVAQMIKGNFAALAADAFRSFPIILKNMATKKTTIKTV